MRDITIKNFRCYEEKTIEFRSGINLLIGDNSVGKTALLCACNYVTSAFFSGYSKTYTRWISATKDDFHVYISERGTQVISNDIDISFHLGEHDMPPILSSAGNIIARLDYDNTLKIEKKSGKNAKPLKKGIKPLTQYGTILADNAHVANDGRVVQYNALPIFTFFSTEDIHTANRKIDKSGFKEEHQVPSFGYFECHDSKGLFDAWIDRLFVLQEVGENCCEINNVSNAISEALGENGCGIISGFRIIGSKKRLYVTYCDGREVDCRLLSDGYRRLVNIVMDIAIRCALLNKEIYGNMAYKHTHGTVIIDEIDEHLHPALQVRVLKALHETFPKIQFIVSTHAPLVMSSVESGEDNIVYKLEYNNGVYSHRELNTYGLDATTIMEVLMGQTARDLFVDKQIKNVFKQIDENRLTDARHAFEELQSRLGTGNPELSRAEAMLSFLEE